MSFIDLLFEHPILEKFLPDRLRPINDELLQDTHTKSLLLRTEQLLDEVIEKTPAMLRYKKTFTNHSVDQHITIKISKKKITLVAADTYRSFAPMKKKMTIECYRKYIKTKNGLGKLIQSTMSFRLNGRWMVRSVRKSPSVQAIFYKIDLLDDTLLHKLMDPNRKKQSILLLSDNSKQLTSSAPQEDLLLEMQRFLQHQKHYLPLDSVLESRLHSLISQTKELIPDFKLLDFEERHMIQRMIRQDLPNLIHTYVSLAPKDQEQHKENVFLALSKMELKVLQQSKGLEESRAKKMEHLLKLNEMRYKR